MQDVSLDFHFLHWMVPKIYHMLHVWNMYQHLPKKSPSYVGKYASTLVRINGYFLCLDLTYGYPKIIGLDILRC